MNTQFDKFRFCLECGIVDKCDSDGTCAYCGQDTIGDAQLARALAAHGLTISGEFVETPKTEETLRGALASLGYSYEPSPILGRNQLLRHGSAFGEPVCAATGWHFVKLLREKKPHHALMTSWELLAIARERAADDLIGFDAANTEDEGTRRAE